MSGFMCGVPVRVARATVACLGCGIVGEHAVHLQSSPYFAPTMTCTNCGDEWDYDGHIYPRPFRRGWRQESIARAIAAWEAACDCNEERDEDYYLIPCEHQERASGCIPFGDTR